MTSGLVKVSNVFPLRASVSCQTSSVFLVSFSKRLKLPALLRTVWSARRTLDSSSPPRPQVCVTLKYQRTSTHRELQDPQPFNPALFSFTVMEMDFFPSQHTEAAGWHGAQCKLWWCDQTCHVNKTRGRWVRAARSEERVGEDRLQESLYEEESVYLSWCLTVWRI